MADNTQEFRDLIRDYVNYTISGQLLEKIVNKLLTGGTLDELANRAGISTGKGLIHNVKNPGSLTITEIADIVSACECEVKLTIFPMKGEQND